MPDKPVSSRQTTEHAALIVIAFHFDARIRVAPMFQANATMPQNASEAKAAIQWMSPRTNPTSSPNKPTENSA